MKNLILLIFSFISFCVFSQQLKTNNKIKSDSDFTHVISGMLAPNNIENLSRKELNTNSKNDSVFSAQYESAGSDLKYNFSIFPASLDEERLTHFFNRSLADKKFRPKEIDLKAVSYKNGNFKMNGISGVYSHLNNLINYQVYDAGYWVFVSEFSQKTNDTIDLIQKHEEVLRKIAPSRIVEKNPLSNYTNNYIAKGAFRDSLMLRSTLSSSFHKLKWSLDSIDKFERAAGIPGIYLEFQIAGIDGFIDYKTDKNRKPSKGSLATNKMIDFLTKLRNDGFLDEFLMEQYQYLLISKDENRKFDFEAYGKWKLSNSIDFDVNGKYYLLVNSRKKTDLTKDE